MDTIIIEQALCPVTRLKDAIMAGDRRTAAETAYMLADAMSHDDIPPSSTPALPPFAMDVAPAWGQGFEGRA